MNAFLSPCFIDSRRLMPSLLSVRSQHCPESITSRLTLSADDAPVPLAAGLPSSRIAANTALTTTQMLLRTWAVRSKPCFRPSTLGLARLNGSQSFKLDIQSRRALLVRAGYTTANNGQSASKTAQSSITSTSIKSEPAKELTSKVDALTEQGTTSTTKTVNGSEEAPRTDLRENIYTIPNLLTVSRIISCPFLGYFIVKGNFVAATSLLFYAGISDLIDGWLARKYNMGTVFGSILDPAADKALMTTLTIALAVRGLLPVPLAVLILGRDVALSISAFYFRYISLPEPKTFKRYWDFSIPSAEVKPTQISKYNTFLQLILMGVTTVSPLVPFNIATPLKALQAVVAGTTIWSGLSYVGGRQGLRILSQSKEAVKTTPKTKP